MQEFSELTVKVQVRSNTWSYPWVSLLRTTWSQLNSRSGCDLTKITSACRRSFWRPGDLMLMLRPSSGCCVFSTVQFPVAGEPGAVDLTFAEEFLEGLATLSSGFS